MPRRTISEMEAEVRNAYPTFVHVEFNGWHYIGRWNHSLMNSANQISREVHYREALADACRVLRRENKARAIKENHEPIVSE